MSPDDISAAMPSYIEHVLRSKGVPLSAEELQIAVGQYRKELDDELCVENVRPHVWKMVSENKLRFTEDWKVALCEHKKQDWDPFSF